MRKAKIDDSGRQNARARKAGNVLSNMVRQRKGKAKELDQEAWLKQTYQQGDNAPERQEKSI